MTKMQLEEGENCKLRGDGLVVSGKSCLHRISKYTIIYKKIAYSEILHATFRN